VAPPFYHLCDLMIKYDLRLLSLLACITISITISQSIDTKAETIRSSLGKPNTQQTQSSEKRVVWRKLPNFFVVK
jgi:hypothetical protein